MSILSDVFMYILIVDFVVNVNDQITLIKS